ncbi:conserved membrane hypothetical protein [uncultured Desulfatiglans sp.]|uniref:DUF2232 domain-containing protein n=1 Tax=Uncultured Desulfatiglans sp. TaxID=1748965 RepID=A0A653A225_UNCDX|nr:conserved membrane hypothetical protein [uncultured Desulfatiglans sp.]
MKPIDVLGCAGWAGVLLSMPVWLPLFGPLFSLLAPLPFFYYSIKLGFRQGLKLTVLVLALIALVAHLGGGAHIAVFGVEFGALGFMLAAFTEKGYAPGRVILLTTGVMAFLGLMLLVALAARRGMGPGEMILAYLEAQVQASIEAYQSAGLAALDQSELEAFSQSLFDLLARIYFSLMVIGMGVVVWLNLIAGRVLLKARRMDLPRTAPLDRWHAPEQLVWALIVSGFLTFLGSGPLAVVAVNVLIVAMAVYLFHGLSIILFFLNRYRVPGWARAGVYFLIFMQQILLVLLALLGLFDQWMDFRKMRKNELENS